MAHSLAHVVFLPVNCSRHRWRCSLFRVSIYGRAAKAIRFVDEALAAVHHAIHVVWARAAASWYVLHPLSLSLPPSTAMQKGGNFEKGSIVYHDRVSCTAQHLHCPPCLQFLGTMAVPLYDGGDDDDNRWYDRTTQSLERSKSDRGHDACDGSPLLLLLLEAANRQKRCAMAERI